VTERLLPQGQGDKHTSIGSCGAPSGVWYAYPQMPIHFADLSQVCFQSITEVFSKVFVDSALKKFDKVQLAMKFGQENA
jgi:hypothetical protein